MKTIEAARVGYTFPNHYRGDHATTTVRTRFRFLASIIAALLAAPILHAQAVTQLWAARYNGPGFSKDYGRAVAVDSAGNVAVTGASTAAGPGEDYYTAKYAAADGALLWEKRYNGPANYKDIAYAVACDGDGNVIVTGSSNGALGNPDYYTAKYAATDGALLWEKRYNGPANRGDEAYALAVDSAGNVAVTGRSDSGSTADYYTAKYAAADGALLWEKRYTSGTGGTAYSVAVDSAGNVAVTGEAYSASNIDYYTAKYAAVDGALLWEKRYIGPVRYDNATCVAMDSAGNVAVTGSSEGAFGNTDYYTAKYASANGALLWEKRYNGPFNGPDDAYSVTMDSAGNVIVTGQSYSSVTSLDIYTAKYAAANGALLWEKRYATGSALAVKVDSADNVVIAGVTSGVGTHQDYYTAKYAAADGALLWEQRYNGAANGDDRMDLDYPFILAGKLALTPDGGAVVTGQSDGDASGVVNYDYATVRYGPSPDGDGDGLLDSWEQTWWGTTNWHSALDDFDGDGIPELVEMAFGLNPTQPDAASLPTVVAEGGYLTITITKHSGVTYQVQSADSADTAAFSPATTTVLMDNATTLKVRDNIPIGTPPARYLRVKVTAAP